MILFVAKPDRAATLQASRCDLAVSNSMWLLTHPEGRPGSLRPGPLLAWGATALLLALILLGSVNCAQAQATATVNWNPSPSGGVTGYKVYYGLLSGVYTASVAAGNTTSVTLTGLVPGTTIYVAATALAGNAESALSGEVVYPVPAGRPAPSLSFAAISGSFTQPFVAVGGVLYQPLETTLALSGQATYDFTITTPGQYIVTSMVYAPDAGANSAFVNIDSQPTDPLMIWDVSISTNFVQQTVTWRDGLARHIFNLSAGNHQLIVRGREAGTQFATFTISPADATLQLSRLPGGQAALTGMAKVGHTYTVQASTNLQKWASIGTVTVDNTGNFQFIDPTSTTLKSRFYRFME